MIDKKIDYIEIIKKNKEYLFLFLLYIFGVLSGVLLFSNIDISHLIKSILSIDYSSFISLFLNRLCLYLLVFTISVLMGLCLIGFPFVNIIPFICGIEIGIKLSYYYVLNGVKGIGYSLLLIIPECSAFITVLFFTIRISNELSKYIFDSSIKKDTAESSDIKLYLKKFLIYAVIVIIIATINATLEYLLKPIINI